MSEEQITMHTANCEKREMNKIVSRKRKPSDSLIGEFSCDKMSKKKFVAVSGSSQPESSVHTASTGGVTIQKLLEKVTTVKKKGLFSEYAAIAVEEPAGTFNTSKLKANIGKNRYSDVLCYDHSLVSLPKVGASYINASFIDGYKQKNAFIGTQGPMQSTFIDFWRMVWHNQSRVIVMTTRTVERSRIKCGQYWPEDKNVTRKFDEMTVTNEGKTEYPDFTETLLKLSNLHTGESRQIIHLQFTGWPDHGIPSASPFLDFLMKVRHAQKAITRKIGSLWSGHPLGPPIVVHCSAGIGRTGTFITVDISLQQLEDIGLVNIQDTVRKIRTQRALAIQVPEQYAFCYLAVIEYAQQKGLITSKKHISLTDIE